MNPPVSIDAATTLERSVDPYQDARHRQGAQIAHHDRSPRAFLQRLLEALHHSRRLQAERFLRTHRHLIAGSPDTCQQSRTRDDDNGNR